MEVFADVDRWWLFVLGATIVLVTLVDLAWTALAAALGRGPLSRAATEAVWRALTIGSPRPRRRQLAGYLVVVAQLLLWVLLLVTGFALTYFSGDQPVVDGNRPGEVTELAIVAYTIGGLAGAGAGFTASTGFWELVNNLSALVGLTLFTLGVTFLLRVVTADSRGRSLSNNVAGLGSSPYEIVNKALTEQGGDTLTQQLVTLSSGISQVAQDHLALPILRYLQPADRHASSARNVVLFDEVLTLLEFGVKEARPLLLSGGRSAVRNFTQTLQGGHHGPPPPALTLEPLRTHAEHLVAPGEFAGGVESVVQRRTELGALLRSGGWTWDDIYTGS